MSNLLHQFSDWYLAALAQGSYWLIAALMALESTVVPIPSEMVIPPAAYLAHTEGQMSLVGIVLAGTAGSWVGATVMYWAARFLGRGLVLRFGPYIGLPAKKIDMAERWAARYGSWGVFFSRLLPVIRHLIGIPAGILRMDYRWYALATLIGSLLWCSVLSWLGATIGRHPDLLAGSLHRFFGLVLGGAVLLGALYYFFVQKAAARA